MSTKHSNSTSAYDQEAFKKGYISAGIKAGKDPLPPYLPATVEYRSWYMGWNKWCNEPKIEEGRT